MFHDTSAENIISNLLPRSKMSVSVREAGEDWTEELSSTWIAGEVLKFAGRGKQRNVNNICTVL
jgi:hypothetical protein